MKIWSYSILAIVYLSLSVIVAAQAFEPPINLEINWIDSSLKQIALPKASKSNYSYPRMIESKKGKLICVYEHAGDIEIAESTNQGETWTRPRTIVYSKNNVNVANPELIELLNGDLLLAYNLRPQPSVSGNYSPEKRFSICVRRSSDGGMSWSKEGILYKAGYEFDNGCWEPSLLQLPSGEIQLFFANEGIYTHSNEQNISRLSSFDNGRTWSKSPVIVSFADGYRDGMPVPLYDKITNRVLLAIEDNSEGGEFNPTLEDLSGINKTIFIDKNSSQRHRLLNSEISTSIYAGAPYVKQTNEGYFVFSFQSTFNRSHDWKLSTMDIAIGKNVDSFHIANRPFNVALDKFALWNSLCITKDNTIIARTCTNAYNDYPAIWMIKGKLK